MGTRHLVMIQAHNKIKLAKYEQMDGYPEGAGAEILEFLKLYNPNLLRSKLSRVIFTGYCNEADLDSGAREILEKIIFGKGKLKVINSIEFAKDSLFCEWGYLINLDTMEFEVYKGNNEEKLDKSERFYCNNVQISPGYYPIRLVRKYSLNKLPALKTFIRQCNVFNAD